MTSKKKTKTTTVARRKKPDPGEAEKTGKAKDVVIPAKCPACGKPVEAGSKACPACGVNLDPGAVRQV